MAKLVQGSNGFHLQAIYPYGARQIVSYNASVAMTNPVSDDTDLLMLIATTDCWFALATSPTAIAGNAGSMFLPANTYVFWPIPKGQSLKVAAIKATGGSAGVLVVQEAI